MLNIEKCKVAKHVALLVSATFVLPTFLAGCGAVTDQTAPAPPPPMMSNRPAQPMPPRQGMSTRNKVILLAGAAALYYIYKKRQAASQQQGPNGKYFLSKNGRVYYRNLKTGAYQWVSPPTQPIQVPAEEAQQYSGFAGYNNRSTGQPYGGYGPGQPNYNDGEPAMPFSQ